MFEVGIDVAVMDGERVVAKRRVRKLYKNGNLVLEGSNTQYSQRSGWQTGGGWSRGRIEVWMPKHAARVRVCRKRRKVYEALKLGLGTLTEEQLDGILAVLSKVDTAST